MRNKLIFKGLVLGLLLLLGVSIACNKEDDGGANDSGKIVTGNSVEVSIENIGVSGGQLEVTSSDTLIDGLQITIPPGAYSESREFKVSYAKIESHLLGAFFNPVSPLIQITNGGGLSEKMMNLRIPSTEIAGRVRMAFYYDKATGELEGIPIVRSTSEFVEVAVRHFSLVVVSDVQKGLIIDGKGFNTFFDPLVKGWSFVNYGTYPEAGGICAGMSIGAAYYYKNFKSGLKLYSYFDNNGLGFPTPGIWEDDATGLHFATAIHRIQEVFYTSNNQSIGEMLNAPEEDRFWNIVYNLLIINQPQLLYVKSTVSDTAHMIIAFGYEINSQTAKIQVYDPNYPGAQSTIEYDMVQKKFKPYTSAANKKALDEGITFNCDQIAFLPLSSVMLPDEMTFLWNKVQNKTIEQGIFPSYKVFAVPIDPAYSRVELKPLAKNEITNYIPFREFNFVVEGLNASYNLNPGIVIFDKESNQWVRYPNIVHPIEMFESDTLIGFNLKGIPPSGKYESWIGFQWFRIRKQDIWIEPVDTSIAVNTEIKFLARNNGSAPKNARYEWDFGNNKTFTSSDTFFVYKYEEIGDFDVSLKVTDLDQNKIVAEVQTTIHVTIWPKIAITLKGMNTTPPSTIKTSDGIDIPAIVWSNKVESTAPAIKWNKNNFETEFTFSQGQGTYICRISGTMSDDFKKVNYLSAIYTGSAFEGLWTYQSAIVLQDFPMDVWQPGKLIGKILTGPDAQAKVKQLSYQENYEFQGMPMERHLGSVDWSSNQTELSIFFYDR